MEGDAVAYYQNIFTQVQVRPVEPEHGIPISVDSRIGRPFNSYLFGLIGNSRSGRSTAAISGLCPSPAG